MQTGKYELITKLAVGGMAEVFLARAAGPLGFEKTLVLKRILPHLAEEPGFVEMFRREAKLAAQLNHPHIVQIFDFGEDNGAYFLAMEYIDGPNLRALLKKARAVRRPLPPALCARLIASACEGLAFAHDFQDPATGQPLGLIHRDISPDNILVSHQGAVKVVDFGIAKTADPSQKTQTGIIKGKLAYMPPEQIRGEPLDRRADVYALGAVLYELLTGHKPFEFPTDASLMQAILFEPLPPATEHRPKLPSALLHILDRALAKERERRYADCRAFHLELEDFIVSTGKPIGAYQLSQFIASLAPSPPSIAKQTIAEQKTERAPSVRTAETALPAGASRTARRSPWLKWLPGLAGAALLMTAGGYIAGTRMGREGSSSNEPSSGATLAPPASMNQAPTPVPREPEAPSSESTMPSGLDVPEKPSEPLVQAEEASQAASQERSGTRRPSSQPGRASTARPQRGDRPAATSRTGTLLLIVRGWADIWVDGQRKGRVPPTNELELSSGRHELKLVNPALKPYRAVVTISAGETLEHRVVLQAADPSPQTARSDMHRELKP